VKKLSVGVLSLQGGVAEHIAMVRACKHEAFEVKTSEDLIKADALIFPGGESTTMSLVSRSSLLSALKKKVSAGTPVFGTCAGLILLAKRVGEVKGLVGKMDVWVERNAYGCQLDSFETELKVKGIGTIPGIFIRAPVIKSVGETVEVLASFDGVPVFVRQGNMLAASFHPELTKNKSVHSFFLETVAQGF